MTKKDKFEFDATSIIKFTLKNIKLLIAVSIVAFIVSAVVSFLIKEKYKSTVIVFPTSSSSISKSIMNINYLPYNKADLLNFGDEDDCDQLTQVLMSAEIKD
ncbi:MAG TPA: Wzz/FepE/Etk N-terminal domain-containing protein, partial [Bacteroidales bacterium]|nr:Wzz/FepE/Etk N-terminal domain-containing protein [Bacteroidales bacterium]